MRRNEAFAPWQCPLCGGALQGETDLKCEKGHCFDRAIDEREVQGTITVPAAQLEALFAMTPYYWKTPRDGAARLAALPQLTTTIAFRFLVFEKL